MVLHNFLQKLKKLEKWIFGSLQEYEKLGSRHAISKILQKVFGMR